MDWVPQSIDAVTRLVHEVGVVGAILVLGFIVFGILLIRHLGQLIDLLRTFVTSRAAADIDIIGNLKDISSSNQAMYATMLAVAASNQQIVERVHKLPSDNVCKARTDDQVRSIIREELRVNGIQLSDEEIEAVMACRKRMSLATKPVHNPTG